MIIGVDLNNDKTVDNQLGMVLSTLGSMGFDIQATLDEAVVQAWEGKAYDNAVWLNPVTRAKEITRAQTEAESKLKETARLDALPKKKAKGVNVSSSGDGSEPTEPTGTLEETVRSTMKKIRERSA